MRVLSFYKPATPMDGPPSAEHMEKMGAFAMEMTARGNLIAAGGLMPGAPYSVTMNTGKMTTTQNAGGFIPDGFHGFGIIQANSEAEMSGLIKRFLETAGDGECQIHPLMEGPPQSK